MGSSLGICVVSGKIILDFLQLVFLAFDYYARKFTGMNIADLNQLGSSDNGEGPVKIITESQKVRSVTQEVKSCSLSTDY